MFPKHFVEAKFFTSAFLCAHFVLYTQNVHFLKAVLGGMVESCGSCVMTYDSNTSFFDCCILSWEKHRSSELEEKLQLDSKIQESKHFGLQLTTLHPLTEVRWTKNCSNSQQANWLVKVWKNLTLSTIELKVWTFHSVEHWTIFGWC